MAVSSSIAIVFIGVAAYAVTAGPVQGVSNALQQDAYVSPDLAVVARYLENRRTNQATKRNLDQYDEYRVRDTDRQLRLLINELTNRLAQHSVSDERLLDAIRDRVAIDEIFNFPNANQENEQLDHIDDGHQVRNLDQIGGGHLVRNLDQIGGGHLLRSLDQSRGASLARNLDHIGGGHLVRNLDQIGGGNLVRNVDSSSAEARRRVDQSVAQRVAAVSRQLQLARSLDRARSNNRLKNIEQIDGGNLVGSRHWFSSLN
ncbi:uncharacterized protein LOC115243459 isoform X1 [Formica exsecta]|uniref:uncharacterized protein LOC115243459 isoform X1 n=1 Tax=Formica exsecta TaxID=72781 RepID=UPI0011426309|nr:uncharacterized protein LOC115243459 isoform X1 [Formica exsecta]